MSKTIRLMQMYLLFGFPFVIAAMLWQTVQPPNDANHLFFALGINLIIWFAVLILFLMILVISPGARENTLMRLANIQERDEREQYITGKAARATYMFTLSLMIFFLFLSTLSVNITETPKKQNVHPRKVEVSIGLQVGLLDENVIDKSNENVVFTSKSIKLSQTAVLLILLCGQLIVFNLVARRMASS